PEWRVYVIPLSEEALRARVASFRSQVARGDPGFAKDATELYSSLLKPAEAQLAGTMRWGIVPDGPLWELPFAALQPVEGRYVLQDRELFLVPSLAVLREMRRRDTRPRLAVRPAPVAGRAAGAPQPDTAGPALLFAVGDPAVGPLPARAARSGVARERLVHAAAEVQAIARL